MSRPRSRNSVVDDVQRARRLAALLEHQGHLLPGEGHRRALAASVATPMPDALRLNPLQPASRDLAAILTRRGAAPVSWCAEAFQFGAPAPHLGQTLEYLLGAFYIQAAAQTLAVAVLDPQPGERILDLCAAPGGKTTQIAARMNNTGLLVANEPRRTRWPPLVGNLERCGVANVVLTGAPASIMPRTFHNYFDRILLDAPCSGDGIVRKSETVLEHWSAKVALQRGHHQVGLLRAAFHMLRPGGILVYSTCSLSLEENESVVTGLLRRYGEQVELLPIDGIAAPPLPHAVAPRYAAALAQAVRVWPHLHDTEGAFVARMTKHGSTQWPSADGDADDWPDCGPKDEALEARRRQLENDWQFRLPVPPDQGLAVSGDYLCREPARAGAFRNYYPYFIRAGIRLARRHRGYDYLSQQAATLLGSEIEGPAVQLDWPEVARLFQNKTVSLNASAPTRGLVLCRFGPWTLTRGLVGPDGRSLQGLLPKAMHRQRLARL